MSFALFLDIKTFQFKKTNLLPDSHLSSHVKDILWKLDFKCKQGKKLIQRAIQVIFNINYLTILKLTAQQDQVEMYYQPYHMSCSDER